MKINILLLFTILFSIFSCSDQKSDRVLIAPPTINSSSSDNTKDIVMMINLKEDSSIIKEYENYHKNIWPEVENANKAAGIKDVKIYRFGRRLVMIITVPEDWNMEEANMLYANSSPKVKEWGELMSKYQEPVPEAPKETSSWAAMELIYQYKN